jgi:tetratricopeptide (TPR) repeat protein
MRSWLLVVAAVLLPTIGWSAGFSVRNPAIRNPVGAGTVPVSSYHSGLISNPIPVDATADLSMTGNVRDGKHFQGNVPYRSISDFGLDPGSSSLNSYRSTPSLSSFLRDTAGSEDFGRRSSGGYGTRPYYSPAETVARTVPGRAEVLTPQGTGNGFVTRQQGRSPTTHPFAMESAPKGYVFPEQGTTDTVTGFQRFQTQYDQSNESLSTSDGAFFGGISPGLRGVERLTPGQADTARRQDDQMTLERLREQARRSSLDPQRDTAIRDRGVPIGQERRPPESGASIPSGASAQDAAATYRLSHLKTFGPSVGFSPEQEAVSQYGTGLRATTPSPTLGEHESFIERQTGGVSDKPGYALPSQGAIQSRPAAGNEERETLWRIRQQLDDLSKSVESRLEARPDNAHSAAAAAATERTYVTRSQAQRLAADFRETAGLGGDDSSYSLRVHEPIVSRDILAPAATDGGFGRVDDSGENRFESSTISSLEAAERIRSLPNGIAELSRAEISHEARRIVGSHRSPASFAADKFSQHLRDGEDYLVAGKYYQAANSFALASVYRPDDSQALAGRSLALFAAGEYVSSALFLSRALAIRPDHARTKVDFVTLLGDPNRLAGRIADVEQWSARSGSGQLQLLLGYVYYQTGRVSQARRAIKAAYLKMPESPAVAAIMAAIDDDAVR